MLSDKNFKLNNFNLLRFICIEMITPSCLYMCIKTVIENMLRIII